MFLPITLEDFEDPDTFSVVTNVRLPLAEPWFKYSFPEEKLDKDLIKARALCHQLLPVTLGAVVEEAPHDGDDVTHSLVLKEKLPK